MKNLSRLTALLLALVMLLSITASATEISNYTKADYDADVVAAQSQTEITAPGVLTAEHNGFSFAVEGEVPETAQLYVTHMGDDTAANIRTNILSLPELEEGMSEYAFDITIVNDNAVWQPGTPVEVTINGLDTTSDSFVQVYHIPDSQPAVATLSLMDEDTTPAMTFEEVEATPGDGTVTFMADGFSIYYVQTNGDYNTSLPLKAVTMVVGQPLTLYSSNNASNRSWKYSREQDGYYWSMSDDQSYTSNGFSFSSNGSYITINATMTGTLYFRYGSNWGYDSIAVTAIANEPVKAYVYVSSKDASENSWLNNAEFQELIGLTVCDANGYFPAGVIELDASFLIGKDANTPGSALIKTDQDWLDLLAALGEMDNNALDDTYNSVRNTDSSSGHYNQFWANFPANNGNTVSEYLDQAQKATNESWGSGKTALFRWHVESTAGTGNQSLGFKDQSVKYHLDLCFNTNKITFITGNNGISSGNAKDGTTVDYRVYITGSEIQPPRNLDIPAGYQFMGYYEDANFTIPWDGIGTPLNKDETVYIKITEKTNVVVQYVPVPVAGGSVSLDNEALNPDTGYNKTGEAQGSVPTANAGYTFDGWYLDEACTQPVNFSWVDASTNKLTPQKGSSEKFEAATYYAKFVENTATINYVPVGPNGENDGSGTVTPTFETLGITTGFATGSTATANTNYKFVGWYDNEACTGTALSTDSTYVPTRPETGWVDGTTYYAKFEYNLTTLTITKKGMENIDAGQSFLFEVTNTGGVDMVIAINGNGSETISGLTVGDVVTVTEIDAWSWRYSADPETITLQPSGNSVTIDNDRDEIYWLDGDCYAENVFSGKK